MFSRGLKVFKGIQQSGVFWMSEARLLLKREKQARLAQKIKDSVQATFIKVDDVSVGSSSCGQMYNITVQSPLFIDKNLVQQHKLVTTAIKEELKTIHGYNLKTKVPEDVKKQAEEKVNKEGEEK